jgi:hypothetical protein
MGENRSPATRGHEAEERDWSLKMDTQAKPVERLLTIAQAAEITSFDEAVIVDWMTRGLPYVAGGEGKRRARLKDRRIRQSALWAWVEGLEVRRVPPSGETRPAPAPRRAPPIPPSGDGIRAWRALKGLAKGK